MVLEGIQAYRLAVSVEWIRQLSGRRLQKWRGNYAWNSAVLKHMDLRNMDVFQLCACAQLARDHIWVTCTLLAEIFGCRMWSEEEARPLLRPYFSTSRFFPTARRTHCCDVTASVSSQDCSHHNLWPPISADWPLIGVIWGYTTEWYSCTIADCSPAQNSCIAQFV